jgi:hypothetical protein
MSEPIRYSMSWGKDEDDCIYVSPTERANGDWVKYADYARLKAEVERLTKAGDAMAFSLYVNPNTRETCNPEIKLWNAAKGVQS